MFWLPAGRLVLNSKPNRSVRKSKWFNVFRSDTEINITMKSRWLLQVNRKRSWSVLTDHTEINDLSLTFL